MVTKQEPAHASRTPEHRLRCYQHPSPARCFVRWWRRDTWRLQSNLARPQTPTSHAERRARGAYLEWLRRLWKHRAQRIAPLWPPWSPSWFRDALCVHHYEGSWHEPGGIGPNVSGGMQIGWSEWHTFGGGYWSSEAFETAPRHQLLVAFRYWRVSKWNPWPTTAELCGLL